jgi:predicted methyltransferase
MIEDKIIKEVLKTIDEYKKIMPKPKRKYDQFYATSQTVIKKTIFIFKKFDLNYKKIAFLGDDDMVSLSMLLFAKHKNLNFDCYIFEIDDDLINFFNQIKEKFNLNIIIKKYDLRKPLNFYNLPKFDLIISDPPYTISGLRLWLTRAIELLVGKGSNKKRKSIKFLKNKFIILSFGYTEKNLEKGYLIQETITNLGLLIHTKIRSFNKYIEADSINNESDLYILQPTPSINLKLLDKLRKLHYKEKIYTYE